MGGTIIGIPHRPTGGREALWGWTYERKMMNGRKLGILPDVNNVSCCNPQDGWKAWRSITRWTPHLSRDCRMNLGNMSWIWLSTSNNKMGTLSKRVLKGLFKFTYTYVIPNAVNHKWICFEECSCCSFPYKNSRGCQAAKRTKKKHHRNTMKVMHDSYCRFSEAYFMRNRPKSNGSSNVFTRWARTNEVCTINKCLSKIK